LTRLIKCDWPFQKVEEIIMKDYTGNKLKQHLQRKSFHEYKKRFCYSELKDYLLSDMSNRVGILYGLRRTGKSTMMYQAMEEFGPENCLYINCSKKDEMDIIFDTIEAHPECKYVFIDEITKVSDFIDLSSVLADIYVDKERKIVIAGTDSLGFEIARRNELYDRTFTIRTTYISYREYAKLLGKDLFNYMQYGGTLSEENIFYNDDNLDEYTNTAIVRNILHTLKYWDMGRNDVLPITKESDMLSFINRLLQRDSKIFVAEALSETFKARDLGSVRQMLEKKEKENKKLPEEERVQVTPSAPLKNDTLKNEIMKLLGVKEGGTHELPEDDETLDVITKYLICLDVLKKEKSAERYYFTQPGMRYCQIDAILQAIQEKMTEYYSYEEREFICNKILQDVEGRMLEDIAYLELQDIFKNNKNISVSKYRNAFGKEFDIVLTDEVTRKSVIMEVKRDFSIGEWQTKHLCNEELCKEYCDKYGVKIVGRAVLYSGEDSEVGDVQYFNTSSFLMNAEQTIKTRFPEFQSMKICALPKDALIRCANHADKDCKEECVEAERFPFNKSEKCD